MQAVQKLTIIGQGNRLFRQGDKGGELYVIKSGQVELTVQNESTGESAVVAIVDAPTVLGTMTFLEGDPRSATAKALTEVKCVIVNQEQRKVLLKQTPGWLRALIKDMAFNLRRLNSDFTTLTNENEKLKKRLAYLKKNMEDSERQGTC